MLFEMIKNITYILAREQALGIGVGDSILASTEIKLNPLNRPCLIPSLTATIYLLAGESHRVIAVLSAVTGGVAALFLQTALDCLKVSCITVSVNRINWCT